MPARMSASVETPRSTGAPGKERKTAGARGDLLLPEDFTRRRRRSPPLCGKSGPKERDARQQLEDELQFIGQKMQQYYSHQQELKSCQRQDRLLSKWLEVRRGSEEQADVQEIHKKLDQLKVHIASLESTLGDEQQLVQKYMNRVQDIRAALEP